MNRSRPSHSFGARFAVLLLLFWCLGRGPSAFGSQIIFPLAAWNLSGTNAVTNSIKVWQVGQIIGGNGIQVGLPIWLNATNGSVTNSFGPGNYAFVIQDGAPPPYNLPMYFQSFNDSNTYYVTNAGVWISGGNFFVTQPSVITINTSDTNAAHLTNTALQTFQGSIGVNGSGNNMPALTVSNATGAGNDLQDWENSHGTNYIDQLGDFFAFGSITSGNGGFIGSAFSLTNVQATNIVGTLTNNTKGTAASATNFSGTLTGNVTGTQGATVVSSVGSAALPAAQITGTLGTGNGGTGMTVPPAYTNAGLGDQVFYNDISEFRNGITWIGSGFPVQQPTSLGAPGAYSMTFDGNTNMMSLATIDALDNRLSIWSYNPRHDCSISFPIYSLSIPPGQTTNNAIYTNSSGERIYQWDGFGPQFGVTYDANTNGEQNQAGSAWVLMNSWPLYISANLALSGDPTGFNQHYFQGFDVFRTTKIIHFPHLKANVYTFTNANNEDVLAIDETDGWLNINSNFYGWWGRITNQFTVGYQPGNAEADTGTGFNVNTNASFNGNSGAGDCAWTFDVNLSHRGGFVAQAGQYTKLAHASGSPFIIARSSSSDLQSGPQTLTTDFNIDSSGNIQVTGTLTVPNETVTNVLAVSNLTAGTVTASNGFAQLATNTFTVTTTGTTNTGTIARKLFGVVGTTVIYSNATSHVNVSLGTITVPQMFILEPNESLSAASGFACATNVAGP